MNSNFTCIFQMMIPMNFVSLVKFGELCQDAKISKYFYSFEKIWEFCRLCLLFFMEIFIFFLNAPIFHMYVSDDNANIFCKFGEIWLTLKRCGNFIIFQWPALSEFFHEKIYHIQMCPIFACMFQMMITINSVSLMKYGEL